MSLHWVLLTWMAMQSVGAPRPQGPATGPNPPVQDVMNHAPSTSPTSLEGQEYKIGRDDLVEVTVFEVPELSSVNRVSASGTLSLPLIGPIDVAGRTARELEKAVEDALRQKYVNDPHVTVLLREYASQPVSVLGAVKVPGIYQIKGQKTLLDILAMAQGLDAVTAGKTIQVIRRSPKAVTTETGVAGAFETIAVDAEELFQRGNASLNLTVQAGDVVNVLQAGSIFVVGEVTRPNEYVLRNGKGVTVTQALALGGGFTREAKRGECVIIRHTGEGAKQEIPVNLSKVLEGSSPDLVMQPNDILFIPANKVKSGLNRTLDSFIAIAVGRAIYGR